MRFLILAIICSPIIKAHSRLCTHIIVGTYQYKNNDELVVINVENVNDLQKEYLHLQCAKLIIEFNNVTMNKVLNVLKNKVKSSQKELQLISNQSDTKFIKKHLNGIIFNFNIYFGDFARCAHSEVIEETLLKEDICKNKLFWMERPLKVLYVKKRITDPMQRRFETIASVLGLEYIEVGVKGYGNYVENIGSNKVDLAMQPILLTIQRYQRVDFISLGFYNELRWVMARPKPNFYNANSIFAVLDTSVWLFLILTIFVGFITLALLDKHDHSRDKEFNWFKIYSMSVTVFISEPMKSSWFALSTKAKMILFVLWVPLGYCMCLTYKANLLANLLALTYDEKIDTTEQVLKSQIPLWIAKDGLIGTLFFNNPSPMMKAIIAINVANGGYYRPPNQSPPSHIKSLRDEGKSIWLAYYVDVKKHIDKYRPGKEVLFRGPQGLGMTKNNPLMEKFSVTLLRYNEGALLHLSEGKFDGWPESRIQRESKIIGEKQAIHFEQIRSTIVVLVLGLSISLISFLIQKID